MRAWVPNLLTGARLVAVIPFTVLLAAGSGPPDEAAAAIFVAASATDYLDGYLARRANVVSRFGRIVDPLADRLLINMAVILLAYDGRLPWWLAAPQLIRDLYLALLFERRRMARDVEVTMTGKVATALMMASLALIMLTASAIPVALFAGALAASVAAGAQYRLRTQEGLTSKPS
jgi:CDP-diacylglycerol--glycerol-3-phosphate 3-phosphatidyltransferase